MNRALRDLLDRDDLLIYKQWLRVSISSKMIKRNMDLFETVDDKLTLLGSWISTDTSLAAG